MCVAVDTGKGQKRVRQVRQGRQVAGRGVRNETETMERREGRGVDTQRTGFGSSGCVPRRPVPAGTATGRSISSDTYMMRFTTFPRLSQGHSLLRRRDVTRTSRGPPTSTTTPKYGSTKIIFFAEGNWERRYWLTLCLSPTDVQSTKRSPTVVSFATVRTYLARAARSPCLSMTVCVWVFVFCDLCRYGQGAEEGSASETREAGRRTRRQK